MFRRVESDDDAESHSFIFQVMVAYAFYSFPLCSFKSTSQNQGNHSRNYNLIELKSVTYVVRNSNAAKGFRVKAKAEQGEEESAKRKSMVCSDCEGNGAVLCSQCKGDGVNAEDLFGGQFKAGDRCWLCGRRKEMLCGTCNGAGFLGGFMSTSDSTAD